MKYLTIRLRTARALMLAAVGVVTASIAVPQRANAQINNPIISASCSGAGVVNCTNSELSTPGQVSLIDLNITGSCQSGFAPFTAQYVVTDKCALIYNLDIIGYTENDQILNDCQISIIGEVDADASLNLVGGSLMGNTYSGQDCEGDEFESQPGVEVGYPC